MVTNCVGDVCSCFWTLKFFSPIWENLAYKAIEIVRLIKVWGFFQKLDEFSFKKNLKFFPNSLNVANFLLNVYEKVLFAKNVQKTLSSLEKASLPKREGRKYNSGGSRLSCMLLTSLRWTFISTKQYKKTDFNPYNVHWAIKLFSFHFGVKKLQKFWHSMPLCYFQIFSCRKWFQPLLSRGSRNYAGEFFLPGATFSH